MKLRTGLIVLILTAFGLFSTSCDKCTESGTVTVSKNNQYFTVTYQTPGGVNYIDSIYRQNQLGVSRRVSNCYSAATNISAQEDFSDGMFGPFYYSMQPIEALPSQAYKYCYILTKDTFGFDNLQVKFTHTIDECHEFWQGIEYSLNGVVLPQYEGQEIANILITE